MRIRRRVDDHRDLAVLDLIADMRAAFLNLLDDFSGNPSRFKIGRGAARRNDLKTDAIKFFRYRSDTRFLSSSRTLIKTLPPCGKRMPPPS